MALRLVAAPASEPVTLAEMKAFLRVDLPNENNLIASLITAARQHLDGADGWLGRCFVSQTWELLLDTFPTAIVLPLAPVQSITSIKYLDTANVLQTLATSVYRTTSLEEVPPRIDLDYGQSWPSVYAVRNAVTVRFLAGYTTVPEPLKLGLKALVAHWYENREPLGRFAEGGSVLPMHVEALLASYRVRSVAA